MHRKKSPYNDCAVAIEYSGYVSFKKQCEYVFWWQAAHLIRLHGTKWFLLY